MGTAEFESVLVSVDAVAEAGVVGFPHPIKGQGVYAHIVAQPGVDGRSMSGVNQTLRRAVALMRRWTSINLCRVFPKPARAK